MFPTSYKLVKLIQIYNHSVNLQCFRVRGMVGTSALLRSDITSACGAEQRQLFQKCLQSHKCCWTLGHRAPYNLWFSSWGRIVSLFIINLFQFDQLINCLIYEASKQRKSTRHYFPEPKADSTSLHVRNQIKRVWICSSCDQQLKMFQSTRLMSHGRGPGWSLGAKQAIANESVCVCFYKFGHVTWICLEYYMSFCYRPLPLSCPLFASWSKN